MRGRTTLPQNATPPELSARGSQLQRRRKQYVYESPETLPGVAFIKGPYYAIRGQTPSLLWFAKIAYTNTLFYANVAAAYNPVALIRSVVAWRNAARKNPPTSSSDEKDTNDPIADHSLAPDIANTGAEGSNAQQISETLRPYRRYYRILQCPRISKVFLQDRVFARLRVAGFNPMSLFRVRDLDQLPFHVDDRRLPGGHDSLSDAIAEHRLYALDFSELRVLGQEDPLEKYFMVTKALFALAPAERKPEEAGAELHAVAIELEGDVVFPPPFADDAEVASCMHWEVAKMAVNTCDAFHHELVAHLGRTHLLVEPFVAATMRQLPNSHPLHRLLRPHFEGTVFINERASRLLLSVNGSADEVFGGEIGNVTEFCASHVLNNRFNASFPDVDVTARGVDDARLHFPYRDDALEHFNALHLWVDAYIRHFYRHDHDVRDDAELHAWATELCDSACGRIKDFGDIGDGRIISVSYLVRAVTFVIFSASVQHAAVNFPQKSFMSYAPVLAGGYYDGRPHDTRRTVWDVRAWRAMLTPHDKAVTQLEVLNQLGSVRHTRLGRYSWLCFRESTWGVRWPEEIRHAHRTYMQRLDGIGARIEQRERDEDLKYDYMVPRNIPQSINV